MIHALRILVAISLMALAKGVAWDMHSAVLIGFVSGVFCMMIWEDIRNER